MAAEQRVFFRDVKPYEVPDDLDTLQGPMPSPRRWAW